jgi:hypothetical protein
VKDVIYGLALIGFGLLAWYSEQGVRENAHCSGVCEATGHDEGDVRDGKCVCLDWAEPVEVEP